MTWPGFMLHLLFAACSSVGQKKEIIPNDETVRLTYTGNMGVLISYKKTAVWIDGLHEYYGPEYLNPPDSMLEKAFSKTKPFSQLRWLLFTHYHRDHFSKMLANRFLQLEPDHKVIGAPQVVDSFSANDAINAWDKNGEILHDDFSTLQVKAFNIRHTWPKRHSKVQNIAYLVEINDVRILHVGDADANPDAFSCIGIDSIDTAIVPVWFTGNEKGKQIIENLKAKKVIVTHIAPGEKHRNRVDMKNIETIFFETIGQFTSF